MVKVVSSKKDKRKSSGDAADEENDKGKSYELLAENVSIVANPLAGRKVAKHLHKLVRKANKQKAFLRKGVRDVQKYIRKGERGIVIIAGDVSPIDIFCHMPAVCEGNDIPYCYTPSKESLGGACGSRRPTCMVLVRSHEDYEELYSECLEEVKALPSPKIE